MQLVSLAVLNKRGGGGGGGGDPTILAHAMDVGNLSWLYRDKAKEFLRFATRELVRSSPNGSRVTATEGQYQVHCSIMPHGLAAVAVTDKDYPERVVFSLLRELLSSFEGEYACSAWQPLERDHQLKQWAALPRQLAKYQDPVEGDKVMAIQKDLDTTLVIMHDTVNAALDRGVKIEELMEKSVDLSRSSKLFYKTAKKQNACC